MKHQYIIHLKPLAYYVGDDLYARIEGSTLDGFLGYVYETTKHVYSSLTETEILIDPKHLVFDLPENMTIELRETDWESLEGSLKSIVPEPDSELNNCKRVESLGDKTRINALERRRDFEDSIGEYWQIYAKLIDMQGVQALHVILHTQGEYGDVGNGLEFETELVFTPKNGLS